VGWAGQGEERRGDGSFIVIIRGADNWVGVVYVYVYGGKQGTECARVFVGGSV
jgi:hypothetical protein